MLIAQLSDVHVGGMRRTCGRWPGCSLSHSCTVSTLGTRLLASGVHLIRVEDGQIGVELKIPVGEAQSLGEYPRDWPEELSARHIDPFVRPQRGESLVND